MELKGLKGSNVQKKEPERKKERMNNLVTILISRLMTCHGLDWFQGKTKKATTKATTITTCKTPLINE